MENKIPPNGIMQHGARDGGCRGWVSVFSTCEAKTSATLGRSASETRLVSTGPMHGIDSPANLQYRTNPNVRQIRVTDAICDHHVAEM